MDLKTLGEDMRHRREELDLSIAEVARRAGVTEAAVRHWEAGDRNLGVLTLDRWMEALDYTLSVQWWYGGNRYGREAHVRLEQAASQLPADEVDALATMAEAMKVRSRPERRFLAAFCRAMAAALED